MFNETLKTLNKSTKILLMFSASHFFMRVLTEAINIV